MMVVIVQNYMPATVYIDVLPALDSALSVFRKDKHNNLELCLRWELGKVHM